MAKKTIAKKTAVKKRTARKVYPTPETMDACCAPPREPTPEERAHSAGYHSGRAEVIQNLNQSVAFRYELAREAEIRAKSNHAQAQRRLHIATFEADEASDLYNAAASKAYGLQSMLKNGVTEL